jgi:bis(5'-nucleosidyl)-tetraphosphatase
MEVLKSCGVLLFRTEPKRSFLLMRHADRWDLPKGHVDPGETETQCALRELWEETGIEANAIRLDPQFRYTLELQVPWREAGGQLRDKQLVVFLAELTKPVEIKLTEHLGYQWFDWNPPHRIQEQTIDGLLAAVERVS